MEYRKCLCNAECKTMFKIDTTKPKMRYARGHGPRGLTFCECKCGGTFINPDSSGRYKRFLFGHGGGRKLGQLGNQNKNPERNKQAREYYAKNRERQIDYHAKRRKKAPEKFRTATRRYVERNHETVLKKQHASYWNDPEKHRETSRRSDNKLKADPIKRKIKFDKIKEYAKKNPEKKKAWKQVEYARRKFHKSKTIPFDNKLWLDKVNASPMCQMCGRFVECENMTQDHVVPLSKEGYHAIVNLQPICSNCNSSKHNRMPSYDVVKKIIELGGASEAALSFVK
jgi:5-methylcytosine-specific restriction endonuclease McrA